MTTTPIMKKVWLDELEIAQMTCGWGVPIANKTVLEKPLTIRGTVFERGVGTHADGEFQLQIHGEAVRFEATVGVDDLGMFTGTFNAEVANHGVVLVRMSKLGF